MITFFGQGSCRRQKGSIAMNLEERAKRMEDIRKAEGLLAYAVSHGDEAEADRLRAELARMLEDL